MSQLCQDSHTCAKICIVTSNSEFRSDSAVIGLLVGDTPWVSNCTMGLFKGTGVEFRPIFVLVS